MELEHSFTIPVPVEEAWPILLDIRQVAPCMPGAAVDTVDGDDFTGTVKVKLGPINLTYKGQAKFVEKDEKNHKAVIDARGRDSRGNGTAAATVTANLVDKNGQTECKVVTDLNITGKPAQFGRGVMADVGNKLIGQFADCLAGKLAAGQLDADASKASTSSEPAKSQTTTSASTGTSPKTQPDADRSQSAAGTAAAGTVAGAAGTAAASSAPLDASAARSARSADSSASKPATGTPATTPAATSPATTAAGNEDKTPTGNIPTASAQQATADKVKSDAEKSSPSTELSGFAGSADAARPTSDLARESAQTSADKQAAASDSDRKAVQPTQPEPIDLIELAGGTVAKKAAPVFGVAAIGLIAAFLLKRKR